MSQLSIGDNRFSVTPPRWLLSINFTDVMLLKDVNISRNLFSGAGLALYGHLELDSLGHWQHPRTHLTKLCTHRTPTTVCLYCFHTQHRPAYSQHNWLGPRFHAFPGSLHRTCKLAHSTASALCLCS